MRLINPTLNELDAAFAEKVAGWRRVITTGFVMNAWRDENDGFQVHPKSFTRSMDAVLPWLEKAGFYISLRYYEHGEPQGWYLSLWENDEDGKLIGEYVGDLSLPRCTVIALLQANGVEVEFTQ